MYPRRVAQSWWMSVVVTIGVALTAIAVASLGEGYGPVRSTGLAHSSDNLLRLHVIAHSDAPHDQNAKLKVRDAVLREMAGWQQPESRDELEAWMSARQDALISAAKDALLAIGHERDVRVEIGAFPFPEKRWEGMTFPAGEYRAIRVVIGDGAGQNWWCVLFPPLCFVEESGEPVAGSIAHAQENEGESRFAEEAGGAPKDQADSTEVMWKLRLWESISESAVVGRVKELVDVSLDIAKRLSP